MKKYIMIIITTILVILSLGACSGTGGSGTVTELVGLFESEEQANECAALYGIELIAYNMGVAVFTTKEDPEKLLAKGEENGWPPLSINAVTQAF